MFKNIFIILSVVAISISKKIINNEDTIFPTLPVTVYDTNNFKCNEDNQLYRQHLKNLTLWAHEMHDANAKRPSGILRGNAVDFGNFEQCLDAKAPFPTQYCLPTITVNIPKAYRNNDPLSLEHDPYESILQRLYRSEDITQQSRNAISIGWCIPASCSAENLEIFLNNYVQDLNLPLKKSHVNYTVELTSLHCQVKEDLENFTTGEIIFCILAVAIVLMLIISAICDLNEISNESSKKDGKKSFFRILYESFSIKRNFNDLNKADESNEALKVLYGMRTCSALIVLIMHRISYDFISPLINPDYLEQILRSNKVILFVRGDLPVDLFFVLSGLLVTYGLLTQLDKAPINPLVAILLRYIRLTPAYAFTIFFYATVLRSIGRGPIWKMSTEFEIEDCRNNWWANLLYINNYYDPEHMCIGQGWYLPCDLHYFIIAIGLCLLIKKDKSLGFLVLSILTVISMLIPFLVIVMYNATALMMMYPNMLRLHKLNPQLHITYIKSHTRATTYLVGVFAGYLYYKLKNTKHHINKTKSNLILVGSISVIVAIIWSGHIMFYDVYREYSALESALYSTFTRPMFGLAIIGLLYGASYGENRLLYKILSWSPLIPLSKLVYGVFLWHVTVQIKNVGEYTSPKLFSFYEVFYLSLADMIMSFIVSFVLYLGVEAPCRNIFKEILTSKKVSSKTE